MKFLKAMQVLALIQIALAITVVDRHPNVMFMICFLIVAILFFELGIRQTQRLRELNNDLYEHSNY